MFKSSSFASSVSAGFGALGWSDEIEKVRCTLAISNWGPSWKAVGALFLRQLDCWF